MVVVEEEKEEQKVLTETVDVVVIDMKQEDVVVLLDVVDVVTLDIGEIVVDVAKTIDAGGQLVVHKTGHVEIVSAAITPMVEQVVLVE